MLWVDKSLPPSTYIPITLSVGSTISNEQTRSNAGYISSKNRTCFSLFVCSIPSGPVQWRHQESSPSYARRNGRTSLKCHTKIITITICAYSQLSNKSTGTMEKKPTKISCGTHFFLRYYKKEFKIFTCGTFISAVLRSKFWKI